MICNIMFTWFEPVIMTSLICQLQLDDSNHLYKLNTTAKLFFSYYKGQIFKTDKLKSLKEQLYCSDAFIVYI